MKKHYILLVTLLSFAFNTFLKSQVEYKDVAPIFFASCTSCHHENQHAPSFMNYTGAFSEAANMVSKLTAGEMPPWSPDTTYSRFTHERIISDTAKNKILDWLAHGAPAGDTTLAPAPPVYAQYQLGGTPDLILQIPTFVSNAASTDSYVCFSLPTGLTQNRILRAYEVVAGNPAIVHHAVINVDTIGTSTSDLSGGCYTAPGDFSLGGYAPGAAPTVFPGVAPLKAGVEIPTGSKIVLQMHYPAGTAGLEDSTQIRLYFYPIGTTGVRNIYTATPLQNWSLPCLPNVVSTFSVTYNVPLAFSIFAAFPHSHKLCKSIVNYAYSTTDTIPLIKINNWDFNWQGFYTFKNMVKVPGGYTLFSEHVYDNTLANPNNPHNPPQLVSAGLSTNDEMLFDSFQFLLYQAGDENINVDSLLAHDPLFSAGVADNSFLNSTAFSVYPNPANDKIMVNFSKKSNYSIELVDVMGKKINTLKTFGEDVTIDLSGVTEGMYFLQVRDLKTSILATEKIIKSK